MRRRHYSARDQHYSARRKEWREEGERLLTRRIQAVAKKGGRKQIFLFETDHYSVVDFLQTWVSDFPAPPRTRFLAVPEEKLSKTIEVEFHRN
mmetsp:Transcript_26694/g.67271  ORF Transcript_26694/g.67271 Transcript_26694/m.67271 type:complete len:93 (+) Transcript_26694:957-1235(+)